MQEKKITNAYKASQNIYDDVLTQNNWLTKLYINLFWGVNDSVIVDKVLEFIPGDFSGKLLDIPVGTAVFTCPKYSKLNNAQITCIDYSNEMLNQAIQRFNTLPGDNITCLQGDAGNLTFEDESFDIVLSMNGFHAFPDKDKAFIETARVLKKSGMFIGCFYIKKEKFLTDLIVNMVLRPKAWFTPPFYTKSELEEILNMYYSKVELFNMKSMTWFKCIK